jgi:hypothetical protein
LSKVCLTDTQLDGVNGGEGNLSPTILDDADLEAVIGGGQLPDMEHLHVWANFGFTCGAATGVGGRRH